MTKKQTKKVTTKKVATKKPACKNTCKCAVKPTKVTVKHATKKEPVAPVKKSFWTRLKEFFGF